MSANDIIRIFDHVVGTAMAVFFLLWLLGFFDRK